MFFVGIDWADKHHDIFIMNEQGKEVASFRIEHSQQGLEMLWKHISDIGACKEDILFALETDKGLLINSLLEKGYTVYALNPQAVSKTRTSYRVSGTKTDTLDAMVLANMLRVDRHMYRPIQPNSNLARELRILTDDLSSLIRCRAKTLNQLISCLKAYYPLALNLFTDVDSIIALQFLQAYPQPSMAAGLSQRSFKSFLRQHGYSCWNRFEEMYDKLKEPQISVDEFIIRSKSRYMLAIISQLQALVTQIKQYEKEIERLFLQHPDSRIFSSLPGAGKQLGPKLLAQFGDNRSRYNNFTSVQCEAGTAPVTKTSGNWRHVSFRLACHKEFRYTIYQFAFCSLNQSMWAKEYYDIQKTRGKKHSAALRILGHKWLKIIYTMWKKGTLYDEQYHLKMKQEHSPYIFVH